ncbi:MAG: hypothetical protein IKY40_00035 [Phascolarctobacterium sp.]|nr:hypothetical protein [Phascolarctobacterium sp.]
MTNKLNILKKTIAIALATVFFSLPFADIASAAPRHEGQPPRHEQRVELKHDKVHHPQPRKKDNHRVEHKVPHHKDKVVVHRPAPPPHHHKKDNDSKVVGGIILGAILGAIVANNN